MSPLHPNLDAAVTLEDPTLLEAAQSIADLSESMVSAGYSADTIDSQSTLNVPQGPGFATNCLVWATVIEPLRDQWQNALAAAAAETNSADNDKHPAAVQICQNFLRELCQTIILDPACGTGEILCATFFHMKRLEREVRTAMVAFTGANQAEILLEDSHVSTSQFLGIESDPRAAAIAALVLHTADLRSQGKAASATPQFEPAFSNTNNIQCREPFLDCDRKEPLLNKAGQHITRWDGKTLKLHPTTGEPVPDHNFRVPVWRYIQPRKAQWPAAHYVIGRPPSLSSARIRARFGDDYFDALRVAHAETSESADFPMYYWNHAAYLLRSSRGVSPVSESVWQQTGSSHVGPAVIPPALRRFGFITPATLRNTGSQQILQRHLASAEISLAFAMPEYPLVDPATGVVSPIAITVARREQRPGTLQTITRIVKISTGLIHPDLTVGANIASALPLRANQKLAYPGIQLNGNGFIVTQNEARKLGLGRTPGVDKIVRPYRNGTDLTQEARNVMVIDLTGFSEEDVAMEYPEIYQWLRDHVKSERETNRDPQLKTNWWLYGKPQQDLYSVLAALPRYIATVQDAKHRIFMFLDASVLPDQKLVAIGLSDPFYLGILSSRIHSAWATAAGHYCSGENTSARQAARAARRAARAIDFVTQPSEIRAPATRSQPILHANQQTHTTYHISRCFESFPFPAATPEQADYIRDIAASLDAHRKQQQALHPRLTLTMIYNVLEKLRRHQTLTAKDQAIQHDSQLAILHQLHTRLDAAVAEAYNWRSELPEGEILMRLLRLNQQRAAEETSGIIRVPGRLLRDVQLPGFCRFCSGRK